MNLQNGAGVLGGGIVVWAVFVLLYLIALAIGLWIYYTIMRHAVTKGVLKALEKAGITTHGRVGTFAVTSQTTSAPPAPQMTAQAPPQ